MTQSIDPAAEPNPYPPANDTAPGPMPAADEALTRIAALETELAEMKDRALRAAAETENVRRRLERERDEARVFAATRFAKDMLSVADNLRRALDAAPKTEDEAFKSFIDGVEVTERELLTIFERHQIKRIEALGARFDPHLHEAVFEMEDAGKPTGTVVQVMMQGYTISGRLLRAAMVAVSKGGPKEAQPAGQTVDTKI
jgi:molecular chaperone GrpE